MQVPDMVRATASGKSLHRAVPMLSAVLILACIAIVELVVGISVLAFIFFSVQKTPGFSRRRRFAFVTLGVLLFSPALVPAGTLAVVPLPWVYC